MAVRIELPSKGEKMLESSDHFINDHDFDTFIDKNDRIKEIE